MIEKECGCLTHEGPHWLHMDHFTKRQNLQLLAHAARLTEGGQFSDASQYLEAYRDEEQRRLAEKLPNMVEGEAYPYTLLGDVEDLMQLAMELWRRIEVIHQQKKEGATTSDENN